MTGMSEYKLTEEILNRSNSKEWNEAKLEWKLDFVHKADEPEACLCGHFPIIEVCVLKNKLSSDFVNVGNCWGRLRKRKIKHGKGATRAPSGANCMRHLQRLLCYQISWLTFKLNFQIN